MGDAPKIMVRKLETSASAKPGSLTSMINMVGTVTVTVGRVAASVSRNAAGENAGK